MMCNVEFKSPRSRYFISTPTPSSLTLSPLLLLHSPNVQRILGTATTTTARRPTSLPTRLPKSPGNRLLATTSPATTLPAATATTIPNRPTNGVLRRRRRIPISFSPARTIWSSPARSGNSKSVPGTNGVPDNATDGVHATTTATIQWNATTSADVSTVYSCREYDDNRSSTENVNGRGNFCSYSEWYLSRPPPPWVIS